MLNKNINKGNLWSFTGGALGGYIIIFIFLLFPFYTLIECCFWYRDVLARAQNMLLLNKRNWVENSCTSPRFSCEHPLANYFFAVFLLSVLLVIKKFSFLGEGSAKTCVLANELRQGEATLHNGVRASCISHFGRPSTAPKPGIWINKFVNLFSGSPPIKIMLR